jgi:GGDEF domain-containing protein
MHTGRQHMITSTVLQDAEMVLWSACLGIYASYLGLSLFYALYYRSASGWRVVAFVLLSGSFVLSASGLLAHFGILTAPQQTRVVLFLGSLSAAIPALGLRHFLRGAMRDTFVDRGMQAIIALASLLLLALLWPNQRQAVEWVAAGEVLLAVGTFWFCLRSWLLGDRLALPMTVACAFLVFAVLGIYANVLGALDSHMSLQLATVVCAAGYVMISCHTLERRDSEYLRMRQALSMSRDTDLLTQLLTGAALIKEIDDCVARARRNRKEMAVLYVEICNTGKLRQEFGGHGLEQVIYGMAARVRHVAGGGATLVGRYSDNSFVVVLDSIKQPSVLRTLGLRLASSVRRPFIINPTSSNSREFRADVGLGVARISPGREIREHTAHNSTQMGIFDSFSLAQDVLHEAGELALAARKFNSRAAIIDAYSRKTIALESAEFK